MNNLKDKCNSIIKLIDLPDDDIRVMAIIHVRQFCNTIAATAIRMQYMASNNDNIPILMQLYGVKEVDHIKSILTDLNPNLKISFITMVQFALENCLERVLCALPRERGQNAFSKTLKKIINVLELEHPEEKHTLLMVPAWIRNTLHAGGIHTKADVQVTIGGENFIFQQGKRVECASWSHIFYVLLKSLDVYKEILTSEFVTAIEKIEAE